MATTATTATDGDFTEVMGMAKITDTDKQKESEFFTEFWKLVKAYYEPEEDDAYWDDLVSQSLALSKGFTRLDAELLNAFLVWVDGKYQDAKKEKAKVTEA